MRDGIYILIGIAVLLLGWLILIYNSMVSKRNGVKAGFSNIDVELKRRYDLIPNLVEVAKKYMAHESQTLTAVVIARNGALSALASAQQNPLDADALRKLGEAEKNVSQALYSFKAVAENYPDLKADQLMLKTMGELSDTENRIAFMRQNYNDLVMSYNTSLEIFPNILFVKRFNFSAATMWTIERAEEREMVRVQF